MSYKTNLGIREEIDRILKGNAKRQANLGTESTDEERAIAKTGWNADLLKIGNLDPEFWGVISAQE